MKKKQKKEFAVIGLGRFGTSIVKTLVDLGHNVLAIDKNRKLVQDIASDSPSITAIIADTTEEQSLKEIGIQNIDDVIVSIGEDIQASILTSLLLIDLGVKNVVAKASDENHKKILLKMGVNHVIQPEKDMGIRVANNLLSKNVVDFIELTPEYRLVELKASHYMIGKNLIKLNIRAKYGCNVMAIKRKNNHVVMSPKAEYTIEKDDVLVMIGALQDIHKLQKDINEKKI